MGSTAKSNMVAFLMVVGVAALQLQTSTAQATDHVVLDSSGWIIPQSGAAAYTAWASNQTFIVGDTLVFNFPTNAHTVAEVPKAAFDACTTTGTLSLQSTPPVRVTLNSSGDHYYLCTVPGHCSGGQKLAVSVRAAAPSPPPATSPSTPPPAPTPSPAATPPPSPTPSPVATPPPAAAPSPIPTPTPSPSPSPTTTPPPSPSGPSPSPSATPPAPSSAATPPVPSSESTPSAAPPPAGSTAPPPPNSAASFAAAALPVTFLSVVMALFY